MAIKYVRAIGGSDAYDGLSFNYGWATIAWAFSASNTRRLAPGDTLAICGDTGSNAFNLTATVVVSPTGGATMSNPFFVAGYNTQGQPLVKGNFVKITTASVLVNGLFNVSTSSQYCKFSNLLFDGGGSGGSSYGVNCSTNFAGVIFDNCRFTNCASYGVNINTGITLIGDAWRFLQCEFDNNGKGGGAGGLNAVGSIYLRGCKIHDNNGFGVQLSSNMVGVMQNCLIYKNLGDGFTCASTGCTIKNNVFFGNTGDGLDLSVVSIPLVFMNNIFRSNGQYGIRTNSRDVDVLNMISCTNNCSNNNTSGHIDINGGVLPGVGNITSNPLFMSETTGSENFTLQSTSPCINAGFNPLT